MKIISRHKYSRGVIIGYTLMNKRKEKLFVSCERAKEQAGRITNARILSNGEFRANKGEHIETIIDNKYLMPRKMEGLQKLAGAR